MNQYLEHASDTRYQPTPRHACDPVDYDVPITDRLILRVHMEVYKKLIRHFSIEVRTEDAVVSRIDTSHSCVHRHQFYRTREQDQPPHYIARIEEGILGARMVQAEFEPAFMLAHDHAHEFLRRWDQ